MNITGTTALITGGSKGIGLSVAEAIVSKGGNVVITARNENEVHEAAKALNARGPGKAVGVRADAREYAHSEAAVAAALEHFGRLDVLIVNAGVGVFKSVQDLSIEDWHAVIDTNLTGAFYSVKSAVPALEKAQGYIITISSLAGKNPFEYGAAYNASKFGLNGFSEAIMLDLRKLGIKVSYIMPGSVATYFNGHTPTEADAWKIQPEDIAQIVTDLLEMPARTLPAKR
jgi:3-oxoacyl-[acyl-carrier protein] reductase